MPASKRHLRRRLTLRKRLTWYEKKRGHAFVYQHPRAWAPMALFASPRLARRKP